MAKKTSTGKQSTKRKPGISLDRVPSSYVTHEWVDYIELLCLSSVDDQISKADLLDRISEEKDFGSNEAVIGDEFDSSDGDSQSEINDKLEGAVANYFRHLQYREGVFKDFYPFYITPDGDTLMRQEQLTLKHKLYLFLLFSSNLGRLLPDRYYTSPLTKKFETLSCQVLKNSLPASAEVHIFGTSESSGGRYSGHLWRKINKLAEDIGERVTLPQHKISEHDFGDNGLDIVGWVPSGDKAEGLLMIFGQCACTPEWIKKQHSSGANAWRQVMTLKSSPANMAFIPFCFRESDGSWCKPQDIQDSILIDRPRILFLIQEYYTFPEDPTFYNSVNEILTYKEPLA